MINMTFQYNIVKVDLVAPLVEPPDCGLTLEWWQYWRTSFREIEYCKAYGAPATDLARRAVNILCALERNLDLGVPLAFLDNATLPFDSH
jgi:hypothetical protein